MRYIILEIKIISNISYENPLIFGYYGVFVGYLHIELHKNNYMEAHRNIPLNRDCMGVSWGILIIYSIGLTFFKIRLGRDIIWEIYHDRNEKNIHRKFRIDSRF
jgi:hypothetical protein